MRLARSGMHEKRTEAGARVRVPRRVAAKKKSALQRQASLLGISSYRRPGGLDMGSFNLDYCIQGQEHGRLKQKEFDDFAARISRFAKKIIISVEGSYPIE